MIFREANFIIKNNRTDIKINYEDSKGFPHGDRYKLFKSNTNVLTVIVGNTNLGEYCLERGKIRIDIDTIKCIVLFGIYVKEIAKMEIPIKDKIDLMKVEVNNFNYLYNNSKLRKEFIIANNIVFRELKETNQLGK